MSDLVANSGSASTAQDVVAFADDAKSLPVLDERVTKCRACPRLVDWRERVANEKRRAFADERYWGRPVPGFGDLRASVLIVGLAPAAHGGNRTGRIFTGDRSGDWLFASLFRTGFANQPTSTHAGDGLRLRDLRITAAVRCAPPENKPSPAERDTCAPWLRAEMHLVRPRVIVALGAFAWAAVLRTMTALGDPVPRPLPRFGHGAEIDIGTKALLGCFHPSQQNTFTGRLTEEMLDAVLLRARERSR